MNFKEKKQEYIDAEGFKLLAFIEDKIIQPKNITKSKLSGSLHQQIAQEASNLNDFKAKLVSAYHTDEIMDLLNEGVRNTARFRDL